VSGVAATRVNKHTTYTYTTYIHTTYICIHDVYASAYAYIYAYALAYAYAIIDVDCGGGGCCEGGGLGGGNGDNCCRCKLLNPPFLCYTYVNATSISIVDSRFTCVQIKQATEPTMLLHSFTPTLLHS
jgi:hypothetical protein